VYLLKVLYSIAFLSALQTPKNNTQSNMSKNININRCVNYILQFYFSLICPNIILFYISAYASSEYSTVSRWREQKEVDETISAHHACTIVETRRCFIKNMSFIVQELLSPHGGTWREKLGAEERRWHLGLKVLQ